MPKRPQPGECNAYFQQYVDLVHEENGLEGLTNAETELQELLSPLSEEQWNHRYAPGKWSVKQLLGHLLDCERIFAYRAVSIARNFPGELPGFDEDDFVANGNFDSRTGTDLLNERCNLRQSSLDLFKSMNENTLKQTGTANGSLVSVRALLFILAGHDRHHLNVVRDRYLNS